MSFQPHPRLVVSPYTVVPQFMGMHSHVQGYPVLWGCIPLYWGAPVYEHTFPYTGATPMHSHMLGYPNMHSHILGSLILRWATLHCTACFVVPNKGRQAPFMTPVEVKMLILFWALGGAQSGFHQNLTQDHSFYPAKYKPELQTQTLTYSVFLFFDLVNSLGVIKGACLTLSLYLKIHKQTKLNSEVDSQGACGFKHWRREQNSSMLMKPTLKSTRDRV